MFKKLEKRLRAVHANIADKGLSAVDAEAAFSTAVMQGQTDIVRRHLDNGRGVNEKIGAGMYPPLYLALMNDHTETALLLLERGADPDAKTLGGEAPLHVAAVKKNVLAIHALIRAGADTGIRNNRRETPLELAMSSQDNGALAALVAGGADVDQKMSNNCPIRGYIQFLPALQTAIEEAAARQHERRVKRAHQAKRRKMRGPA